MRGEIVNARTPGIRRRSVAAPALPHLSVELVLSEGPDGTPVRPRQGWMDVHHVKLGVGIARVNADVEIDFGAMVASGDRETVHDDPKHIAFGYKLEPPTKTAQPVEVFRREVEITTALKPLRLIQREGDEALNTWSTQINLLIEFDAARLSALDLEIDRELLGRLLPGTLEQLPPGQQRNGDRDDLLVDPDLVLRTTLPARQIRCRRCEVGPVDPCLESWRHLLSTAYSLWAVPLCARAMASRTPAGNCALLQCQCPQRPGSCAYNGE